MAQRKVPRFLSKDFAGLSSTEEKKKLLDDFDIWKSSFITKSYILFLEQELEKIVREDEDKTDWLSAFAYRYKQSHNKGKRSILRSLLQLF